MSRKKIVFVGERKKKTTTTTVHDRPKKVREILDSKKIAKNRSANRSIKKRRVALRGDVQWDTYAAERQKTQKIQTFNVEDGNMIKLTRNYWSISKGQVGILLEIMTGKWPSVKCLIGGEIMNIPTKFVRRIYPED